VFYGHAPASLIGVKIGMASLTAINASACINGFAGRDGEDRKMHSRGRAPEPSDDGPPVGVKVAFLSAPETYGDAGPVGVRETHMAWVFLTGDRVYKLKKPVRYTFLDYSTLEARRRICADEVRLNRRLAPDVYLGTARMTVEASGAVALDGAGEVVDWLVVMRRLPEQAMLDQAIAAGTATPERIGAVADRLAAFYLGRDPVAVDPVEHLAHFARELGENCRVFSLKALDSAADRGARLSAELDRRLQREPQIVTDRVEAGAIVEGHGDLRPEHVCLGDPPVIIDCLEFSRALRLVDPFDELAFLGMECAALGAAWIGPMILERCGKILRNRASDRLVAFYTAYRATFRARQALAHLLEPHPRTPGKWIPLANRYLDRAELGLSSLRSRAACP